MAKGTYTNDELIDSIIIDFNKAVQNLITGNYLAWCNDTGDLAHRLIALKKGVADEITSKERRIEELKENLRECGVEVKDIPIDEFIKKGGADNGE